MSLNCSLYVYLGNKVNIFWLSWGEICKICEAKWNPKGTFSFEAMLDDEWHCFLKVIITVYVQGKESSINYDFEGLLGSGLGFKSQKINSTLNVQHESYESISIVLVLG